MNVIATGHCAQCAAVINIHWLACLVCGAILREAPVRLEATPENGEQAAEPLAPILPGWLVTYRNEDGRLCGGYEDKAHGTVQVCQWNGIGGTLHLTDGQRLAFSVIQAVGKTDATGRIRGAWRVREHGYDGTGPLKG